MPLITLYLYAYVCQSRRTMLNQEAVYGELRVTLALSYHVVYSSLVTSLLFTAAKKHNNMVAFHSEEHRSKIVAKARYGQGIEVAIIEDIYNQYRRF